MTSEPHAPTPPADALAEIRERVADAERGVFPNAWYGNAATLVHTDSVDDLHTLLAEVDRLAARVKEITTERDEAQSACMAWRHVFGSIEAHIGDRMAMGDPADPETYLSIIRGDVADIERRSRQIVAARWTAVRDAEAARDSLAARVAALEAERDEALRAARQDEREQCIKAIVSVPQKIEETVYVSEHDDITSAGTPCRSPAYTYKARRPPTRADFVASVRARARLQPEEEGR